MLILIFFLFLFDTKDGGGATAPKPSGALLALVRLMQTQISSNEVQQLLGTKLVVKRVVAKMEIPDQAAAIRPLHHLGTSVLQQLGIMRICPAHHAVNRHASTKNIHPRHSGKRPPILRESPSHSHLHAIDYCTVLAYVRLQFLLLLYFLLICCHDNKFLGVNTTTLWMAITQWIRLQKYNLFLPLNPS